MKPCQDRPDWPWTPLRHRLRRKRRCLHHPSCYPTSTGDWYGTEPQRRSQIITYGNGRLSSMPSPKPANMSSAWDSLLPCLRPLAQCLDQSSKGFSTITSLTREKKDEQRSYVLCKGSDSQRPGRNMYKTQKTPFRSGKATFGVVRNPLPRRKTWGLAAFPRRGRKGKVHVLFYELPLVDEECFC